MDLTENFLRIAENQIELLKLKVNWSQLIRLKDRKPND